MMGCGYKSSIPKHEECLLLHGPKFEPIILGFEDSIEYRCVLQ